jgi:hypothetical protein
MKASVARTCKDKNGQWKSTASFNRDEVAMVEEQNVQGGPSVVEEEVAA